MKTLTRIWQPRSYQLVLASLLLQATTLQASALEFRVTYDKSVTRGPFTGRVYVLVSKQEIKEPPSDMRWWFKPEPLFGLDVTDWQPDQPAVLGQEAIGYPIPLANLPGGTYWVQAVMDFGRGRSFTEGEGNGYSVAQHLELNTATSGPIGLRIERIVAPRPFRETAQVKLVDVESKLLSAFAGHPVRMRAAVILPDSFATNPQKRYPVIYEIPGFGGTHSMAWQRATRGNSTNVAGMETLYVVLDPSCPLGHHVFADSDNNGPRGLALTEELIPYIENKFRGQGVPAARFVTGHSSGGWSSLWLQVAYPDFFGGVWSTSPDPVDFRDFQRINLYKPGANMFVDENGRQRPIARRGGQPVLFYKPFSDMEVVTGHGGQLGSFEAVFSPRGTDGKPKQLWDRKTGKIDAAVTKAWERYDIRLVLERHWKTLGPKLAGKLHIYTGGEDTFYLEGAVELLKRSLAELGSDALVEIFPGRDHGTVIDGALRQRMAQEMADSLRRNAR